LQSHSFVSHPLRLTIAPFDFVEPCVHGGLQRCMFLVSPAALHELSQRTPSDDPHAPKMGASSIRRTRSVAHVPGRLYKTGHARTRRFRAWPPRQRRTTGVLGSPEHGDGRYRSSGSAPCGRHRYPTPAVAGADAQGIQALGNALQPRCRSNRKPVRDPFMTDFLSAKKAVPKSGYLSQRFLAKPLINTML
jgi:hypothetical protein